MSREPNRPGRKPKPDYPEKAFNVAVMSAWASIAVGEQKVQSSPERVLEAQHLISVGVVLGSLIRFAFSLRCAAANCCVTH
jgi:hypothetical protein